MFKGLAKERRKHSIFLARGLHAPFATFPIFVCLRIRFQVVDELLTVNAGNGEQHRGRHHFLFRGFVDGHAGPPCHIAVAGGIDHLSRQDRFPTSLAFRNDAFNPLAFHHWLHEEAMQHRYDPSLQNHIVRDHFEGLAIQGVTVGLWFRSGGAHFYGTIFELATNAF